MSSLDDLAERCGRCATTFAEADREVAASLRIIDEIVRESARDTRVYFPGVLARVWVDAHSSIHAIDQRLSMTVATLETAASALEAIRDADDADQVIDALEAEHLDLNRIGTSVTSCQEDLGALIAEGTIAFGNSRKGARVLRHLSHALALVTPAATALAPAITERMVLITSLLEPYDEPTLQRFNAGAAAHDAIDTLTDLVAFGQNLLATLRLAEDSLNATADLVDQATERAEGMSPRRLPV